MDKKITYTYTETEAVAVKHGWPLYLQFLAFVLPAMAIIDLSMSWFSGVRLRNFYEEVIFGYAIVIFFVNVFISFPLGLLGLICMTKKLRHHFKFIIATKIIAIINFLAGAIECCVFLVLL